MRILLITIAVLTMVGTATSQNRGRWDETWWIGYYVDFKPDFLVNFKEDEPVITDRDDPMVNEPFATTSICSGETGRLLFNSNGCWIADSTAQLMENGDSIAPSELMYSFNYYPDNLPIGEGIIALEFGNEEDYAILNVVPEIVTINGVKSIQIQKMCLSRIKLDFGHPNGIVTEHAKELFNGNICHTGLSACRHANGRDWWVVFQLNDVRSSFVKFLVGPNYTFGPYIQDIQVPISKNCGGTCSFTPDGTKWLHSEWQSGTQVFDFDRMTGKLSNFRYIKHEFDQLAGDIVVSPSGQYMYLLDGPYLRQFDISKPSIDEIQSSEDTVGVYNPEFKCDLFGHNFGGGKLAPNGKIYINTTSSTCAWSVIHKPDRKGTKSIVKNHDLILPRNNGGLILPNQPNYRLGPIDGSSADTLGIDNIPVAKFRKDADEMIYRKYEFTDLSFYEPATWSWDFGDGSFSSDTCPVHTYQADGVYQVCLTVSNVNGTNTYCKELNIMKPNATNLIQDYGLTLSPNPCSDYLFLNVKQSYPKALQMSISDSQGKTLESSQIFLNNGFTTIDVSIIPAGSYFMTLKDSEGNQEVLQFVKQ